MPVKNSSGEISMTEYHINNMIAGDTDSAYMKLDEKLTDHKSEKEIVEFCDNVCEEANSMFAEYCKDMFNCPTDRAWTVAADREAVSDKSWFLTKKRYVMHVIDMEGEEVDELKLMGLEIKKSDTPPIVKDILMDMVNMVLDGTTRPKLQKRLQEWKEKYYESDLDMIGKPSGCKTLKQAYDQLNETGSLKGVHYASRSAIFYNSLCNERDRKVRLGDKISIVYINHPDSKYIGFPRDAEMLPEWLEDEIIIDYDTNWKLAEKKINNYMETLGWDIKSMNNKIKQDLFGF